jgi:hypothetical protein
MVLRFVPAIMAKHLSSLKVICHLLSYFCNMWRSSWSFKKNKKKKKKRGVCCGGGGGGGVYGFLFRSEFFFLTTQELEYFFCRAKHEFFFQNLTLGHMTKTLNQIIFFSSTKIRIFFSATSGFFLVNLFNKFHEEKSFT